MVLYYKKIRQSSYNTSYPDKMEITTSDDLNEVVCYDHVCAEFAESCRKSDSFISADCSMFDADNTDSDDPNKWVTPETVRNMFPDVPFYVSYSRNHMKEKNGKEPRPKFHVYFPDMLYTDMDEYRRLKENVCRYFTAFDQNAKDVARFFFGVEKPSVEFYPGNVLLSEFMKDIPDQTINENKQGLQPATSNEGYSIPEGTRNTTMFQFAERILRDMGDTDKAFQCYMDESRKCIPLLDDNELNSIWKSAQKRYYASMEVKCVWDILSVNDSSAMKELLERKTKDRKFNIAAARLFLRCFGLEVRLNEMNRRTKIVGLPPQYSGENAHNLLVTLIGDFMSTISYKRAVSSIIYDTLEVIASENHYHPVLKLLNDEPWDGVNRLPDIYNILSITDDFSKTLVMKWALQTIAVLYNFGDNSVAAQGVLVLQGNQGMGKTEFFRHLAIRDEFFKEGSTLDMSNKDSLISATKVWICELGEIDSTTKKEQSALKGFLTGKIDRFREAYARAELIRPRRTSFCGTVNNPRYLRDETGNRRFWTVPVKSVDVEAVFRYPPAWYAQFWRQIHEEYKRNPKGYLLTKEEQDRVNQNNSDFEAELYGEDEFMTLFDTGADISTWVWRTAAEIAKALNESYKGLNISSSSLGRQLIPRLQHRIGKGFARKTVKGNRKIQVPPLASQSGEDNYPCIPSVSFRKADDSLYTPDTNIDENIEF